MLRAFDVSALNIYIENSIYLDFEIYGFRRIGVASQGHATSLVQDSEIAGDRDFDISTFRYL